MKFVCQIMVALLMATFGSMPFVVHANGISQKGLPPNALMKETNPKSIFFGDGSKGLQQAFLAEGALRANIYTIIGKSSSVYTYALAGDIQLGPVLLSKMLDERVPFDFIYSQKEKSSYYLEGVKNFFVDYIKKHPQQYAFVVKDKRSLLYRETTADEAIKYDKGSHSYVGIVSATVEKGGIVYSEFIYFRLYNDKYYGPSLRFLEVSQYNQASWGDTLAVILNI